MAASQDNAVWCARRKPERDCFGRSMQETIDTMCGVALLYEACTSCCMAYDLMIHDIPLEVWVGVEGRFRAPSFTRSPSQPDQKMRSPEYGRWVSRYTLSNPAKLRIFP